MKKYFPYNCNSDNAGSQFSWLYEKTGVLDRSEKIQPLVSNVIKDEEGHVFIIGTAKTMISSILDLAEVIVKFYNFDTEVICTSSSNVEALDPGEILRSEVIYRRRDATEVYNYTIRFNIKQNWEQTYIE